MQESSVAVHCTLVSPIREVFSGLVNNVVVCGIEGELGIYHGHAPLITALKPGSVTIQHHDSSKKEVLYVSGGYLEVQPESIFILAHQALAGDELEEESIKRAKAEAEQRMQDVSADNMELAVLTQKMTELLAQLSVIRQIQKNK